MIHDPTMRDSCVNYPNKLKLCRENHANSNKLKLCKENRAPGNLNFTEQNTELFLHVNTLFTATSHEI